MLERVYVAPKKDGLIVGLFLRPHESDLKYVVKVGCDLNGSYGRERGFFDHLGDAYRFYNQMFREGVVR